MAYHISKFQYEKLPVAWQVFLARIKHWDINSLVTDEDFEIHESQEKINKRIIEDTVYWQPTTCYSQVYLQRNDYKRKPKSRFLVSFAATIDKEQIAYLAERGFQVYIKTIVFMGNPNKKMLIVAEENVNIDDCIKWCSKIDMRNWHLSSYLINPIGLPIQIKITMGPKQEETIDTQVLVDSYLKDGRAKTIAKYGYFNEEDLFRNLVKRIEKIKRNEPLVPEQQ